MRIGVQTTRDGVASVFPRQKPEQLHIVAHYVGISGNRSAASTAKRRQKCPFRGHGLSGGQMLQRRKGFAHIGIIFASLNTQRGLPRRRNHIADFKQAR